MPITRRSLLTAAVGVAAVSQIRSTSAQESPWSMLDDGGGPAARWDHALLADATGNRLFLFGGRDGNGAALGDLWSFDRASGGWSSIDVAGPAPRFGVAAAVLPDGSGFLLFGGQSESVFYNDLWQFDFASTTWTLVNDGAGVAPFARYGFGGDFDAAGRYVISHGFTFDGRFDDTWAFDPSQNAWTDVSPAPETRPLPRCLHEVISLEEGARLLIYAGCSSGYGPCPQGDLWSFDTASGQWTELVPDVAPAARSNPAVTRAGSGLLMLGGLTEAGPTADVWQGTLEGETYVWSEVTGASNAIAPRSSHDMATIGEEHFVFGGLGVDGVLADLWSYSPVG
jgi:hypothetical protein